MTTIDPRAIEVGKLFAQYVEEALTAEQYAEMLRLNATPEYATGACASHNYIDANEAMEDAFRDALGYTPHGDAVAPEVYADPDLSDADIAQLEAEASRRHAQDTALWNAAWEWAKAHYLTDNATHRALESDGWPEIPSTDPTRVCACTLCATFVRAA